MNDEVLEKIETYNNGGLVNKPIFSFSFPKEKTVDLVVEQAVTTALARDNPANVDEYIRTRLARQLAEKLIEEDLIQIQSCEDIETKNTTFRAKIKVVQE